MEKLIQAGGDVNEQNGIGWTPLHYASHYASREGHVDVVNILIQAGGEVNQKDKWGWTPLHFASMCGHVEVITALLAAGADKTIKNEDGHTPHDLADGNQDIMDDLAKHQDCKNALE